MDGAGGGGVPVERASAPVLLLLYISGSNLSHTGLDTLLLYQGIISFYGIVYKKGCTLCKWNGGNCRIFSPGEQNSCQRGTLMF